jgi:hypothetical protein
MWPPSHGIFERVAVHDFKYILSLFSWPLVKNHLSLWQPFFSHLTGSVIHLGRLTLPEESVPSR